MKAVEQEAAERAAKDNRKTKGGKKKAGKTQR
jgi:hypothetical protein